MSDSTAPVVTVITGHRPPAEVLDYAYDLWAWKHGQSAAAVAKELDIPARTVQRWARDENWRIRYEEDRAELTPQMSRYATALILGTSAPKAAGILDAMVEGTIPFDKTKATVCQIILDRTGFAPINLKDADPAKKPDDDIPALPDFSSMSPEQLRSYDELIRKQSKRKTLVATERMRT